MTEAEWLTAGLARPMLEFLAVSPGDRKLRLWACACLGTIRDRIGPWVWCIVETAEAHADGAASDRELRSAKAIFDRVTCGDMEPGDRWANLAAVMSMREFGMGRDIRFTSEAADRLVGIVVANGGANTLVCNLLRDIFGNPFRPVILTPTCRTPAVLALAQAAYDERTLPSGELDGERLAVLADALEDAGATGDILTHLRGPGPHVRGCWALDLALGKE